MNYEKALKDVEKGVQLLRNDEWVFAIRGEIHRSLQLYENALADFTKAIQLDPEYDWALAHRAKVHHELGNFIGSSGGFQCCNSSETQLYLGDFPARRIVTGFG